MMPCRTALKYASASLALGVALATANPAAAASNFSASAIGNLTLVQITSAGSLAGLSFSFTDDSGSTGSFLGAASQSGDATVASFDDPLGLGVGFDLEVSAFADGIAGDDVAQLAGSSEHEAYAMGFMTIFNGSANAVDLTFGLNWLLDTAVGATGGLLVEDAFGDASFEVTVNGASQFLSAISADVFLGPLDASVSELDELFFTLAPGETLTLDLSAAAFGTADASPVPVPAALPLLGSALAGLWGVRRRRAA
jgi:hypothetical protein